MWLLKLTVAFLWVASWVVTLDPTREAPDRYGMWTITFLATFALGRRVLLDWTRAKGDDR